MKTIFVIVSGIFFFSCTSKKVPERRNNEITKICFATGGCYGECPVMAIEIDSSLNYKFYGRMYTKKQGYFLGSISRGFWDTLNMKFESINYKKLDTMYVHWTDAMGIQVIIYYNNKRKQIIGESESLPDSVMKVYDWLMNTYKRIGLNKSNDTLNIAKKFETHMQNPLPPPPPNLIEALQGKKIIPPKYKK